MLRKLTALSALALSLFVAKAAHADWYMVSEYEFHSFTKSTAYEHSGGRGGYVASGHPYVTADIRIPVGKTIASLWCQVLDASPTKDIKVSLYESATPDNASNWVSTTLITASSAGAPGHTKINGYSSGSPVVRTYTCPNTCYYYTYHLDVSLLDTSNTNIKSCAIEYY